MAKQVVDQPTRIGVLVLGSLVAGDDHKSFQHEACSQQNRSYHTAVPAFNGGRGTSTPRNGRLSQFVPNYSSVLALISDLLRDTRFRSKKARRLKVPWAQAQTEAMETPVSPLTSPPILALPDRNKYFRLHTDPSETGVGTVLTQIQEMVENTLAYASHQWSKTDEKKSPTDRECLAVLWAVDKFASYL